MKVRRILRMATAAMLFALFLTLPADAIIKQGETGAVVTQIQLRLIDLDYYSFKPTASFGGMTRQGVIYFQEAHKLLADGSVGDESLSLLFDNEARRNSIPAKVKIPIGPGPGATPAVFGTPVQWKTKMAQLFALHTPYRVCDLNTAKTFSITRTGGINHALVEPTSAADNAIILEIFGGAYNWSKRPMLLEVGGIAYAASLQGMPYGAPLIAASGMNGALPMYFQGSTSDSTNLPDEEHRRTLLKATGVQWK